jgi:hypothetical protein
MVKERDVVCHRLDGLSMLVGMLQDLVACDDATFDFIKDDVPPEFDQSPTFVPGNGAGVRFKEAEDGSRSEGTFLPSRTRRRVCAITRFTRGSILSASLRSRVACRSLC